MGNTNQVELYQSVLQKLSAIPVEYLSEVEKYLEQLKAKQTKQVDAKERAKITMSLAGAWSDMSEDEFNALQKHFEEVKKNMFNKDIEL